MGHFLFETFFTRTLYYVFTLSCYGMETV